MRRVHFPRNRVLRWVALALGAVALAAGVLSPAAPAEAYDYVVPCGEISTLNYGIINTNAQQGDVVHMILAANCTYILSTAYDPVLGNGLPRFTGAGGAMLVIDGNGSTIERADGSAPFSDAHGNAATASFAVTIGPPPTLAETAVPDPTPTPTPTQTPDQSETSTPAPAPTSDSADGPSEGASLDLTAALLAGGALAMLLFLIGLGWAISLRRP